MQKISTIVLYILAAVSVVFALMFFFGPSEEVGGYLEPEYTSLNLKWAYVLFGIAVVLTFGFMIEYLFTHPKALKGAAIALVCGGVLLLVSYSLASGEPVEGSKNAEEITTTGLKWVGTGIYAMYILGGVALLAMVFSEIIRAFK